MESKYESKLEYSENNDIQNENIEEIEKQFLNQMCFK